jgi:SSS family transporter
MVTSYYVSVFVVYMLFVFGLGIYLSRWVKSEGDFWVANRQLNGFVGGCSIAATQMSAGSVIGSVGLWYGIGWAWVWVWPLISVGYIIAVELVGRRMQRLGYYTIPDYLEARFGSNVPRAIAAVVITISFIAYIGAQTMAAGYIFRTLFGWPFVWGAIFFTAIYIAYTILGGMFAVAYTDMIQVIVMSIGGMIAVPIILDQVGGLAMLNAVVHSMKSTMVGLGMPPFKLFGFFIVFGLFAMSAPQLLIRIVTVKNYKEARIAVWWAALFNILIITGFAAIGVGCRALFPQLASWDLASPTVASSVLPPLLGGLLLSALLAAMMSTTDSLLLTAGSAVAHDIYAKMINPEATEKQKLFIGRVASLLVGVIPFALIFTPYFKGALIQFIVASSVALAASTFFGPIIIGLTWKRATKQGCIWAMTLGFFADAIWLLLKKPLGIHEVLVGLTVSLLALIVISYNTPQTPREQLEVIWTQKELEEAGIGS